MTWHTPDTGDFSTSLRVAMAPAEPQTILWFKELGVELRLQPDLTVTFERVTVDIVTLKMVKLVVATSDPVPLGEWVQIEGNVPAGRVAVVTGLVVS